MTDPTSIDNCTPNFLPNITITPPSGEQNPQPPLPKITISPPSQSESCSPAWTDPTYLHHNEHLLQLWLPYSKDKTHLTPPPNVQVLDMDDVQALTRNRTVDEILFTNRHDTMLPESAITLLPKEIVMDSDMEIGNLERLAVEYVMGKSGEVSKES